MEKNTEHNENKNTNTDRTNTAVTPIPVYNLIILDKSGSMHSVRREAVDAYNETLGTIKAAQKQYADTQQQFVSLAAFCSCGIEMIYDKVPADEAAVMDYDQYNPCCCTPLFDAVGSTINKLKNYAEPLGDYAAVVTIITDGYENDSKEWTGEQVRQLIAECREKGWVVTFIGAMEDAETVAASMSISITNVIRWEQTHEGTQAMSHHDSNSRMRHMKNLNDNVLCCMCSPDMSIEERKASRKHFSDAFYVPDDDDAEDNKADNKSDGKA